MPPKPKKKGVSFVANVGSGVPFDATATVRTLLQAESDTQRLAALQRVWDATSISDKEKLVRETASQFDTHSASSSPMSLHAHLHLRNLLSLLSLLARREYGKKGVAGAGGSSAPLECFPRCVEGILVLLEAPERTVDASLPATANVISFPAAAAAGSSSAAAAHAQAHAIKFYALHAFNRLVEGFPTIVALFLPLALDICSRELFPSRAAAAAASSAATPSLSAAPSAVAPTYAAKLLESLGLILASRAALVAPRAHELLAGGLELLGQCLADIESFEPQAPTAAAAEDGEEAPAPAPLSAPHQLALSLLDFLAQLLPRAHLRAGVLYPSARWLQPRAWPLGSEEAGEEREDEEEDADDDEERQLDEDEDEEEEAAAAGNGPEPTPRKFFTQQLEFNPARRGSQPLRFDSHDAAADLFDALFERVCTFVSKLGVTRSSGAPALTDAGSSVLAFLPHLMSLANCYAGGAEGRLTSPLQRCTDLCVDLLRELDLSAYSAGSPTQHAAHQLWACVEGVVKHCVRSHALPILPALYADLTNWLAEAVGVLPRSSVLKLRRAAVGGFQSLLYALDTAFTAEVGVQSFFSELFPLLANPLLTSHLIYVLRDEPEDVAKKTLAQVMRGLLNTNTRSSPSVKTVQMILTSIGNVACFTRAFACARTERAELPLLAPYMTQILETVGATMEGSPSGTGQVACLLLCRIVMAAYDMPEVQSFLPRVLGLYLSLLDESLFVSEQESLGDSYDEDDQDLVSQTQYCALDMLHVLVQDLSEGAQSHVQRAVRGIPDADHPFKQAEFVRIVAQSEECVQQLRELIELLLENTKKPIFFNDDAALRNSEIHLLKEILSHPPLWQALLAAEAPAPAPAAPAPAAAAAPPAAAESSDASTPEPEPLPPLAVSHLVLTLLNGIATAHKEGYGERKYNYHLCLASVVPSVQSSPEMLAAVSSALQSSSNKQLLADVKRDATTWKTIQPLVK